MSYTIELLKREHQPTSHWAGGTTTQLAICPKSATLVEKNFQWRLSSAKVEIEESTFTSFPGIWRHLMVLEGELRLVHEGHHETILKPYEQDRFSGDWTTRSFGRVKDFNLMLAKGCCGELEVVQVNGEALLMLAGDALKEGSFITEALYCSCGTVEVIVEGVSQGTLQEGDILVLCRENTPHEVSCRLINRDNPSAYIVRARIIQS